MGKFRINRQLHQDMTVDVTISEKGLYKVKSTSIAYDYDWIDTNDEILLTSLETKKKTYPRSEEAMLKAKGIDYELEQCKACGGTVLKPTVYLFEVVHGN